MTAEVATTISRLTAVAVPRTRSAEIATRNSRRATNAVTSRMAAAKMAGAHAMAASRNAKNRQKIVRINVGHGTSVVCVMSERGETKNKK